MATPTRHPDQARAADHTTPGEAKRVIDWRTTQALAVDGRIILTIGLYERGVRLGCRVPDAVVGEVVSVILLADTTPIKVTACCVGRSGDWAELDMPIAEGWPVARWFGFNPYQLDPPGRGGIGRRLRPPRIGLNVRKRKPPKRRR